MSNFVVDKYEKINPELINIFEGWLWYDENFFNHVEAVAYAVDIAYRTAKRDEIMERVNDDSMSWMFSDYSGTLKEKTIIVACFAIYVKITAQFYVWSEKMKPKIKSKDYEKEIAEVIRLLDEDPVMLSHMRELFISAWAEMERQESGWAVKMY